MGADVYVAVYALAYDLYLVVLPIKKSKHVIAELFYHFHKVRIIVQHVCTRLESLM